MDHERRRHDARLLVALLGALLAPAAMAGLTDNIQTPHTENAGIAKSLEDQAGPGRGDLVTPGSSAWVIARDPFRSIRRGRQIFQRKFTFGQGLGPRTNDGDGPGLNQIHDDASLGAGLADSCAACHGRPRGAAGFGGEVFTRPDSRDSPHLFGLGLQEMLADEMTTDLRAIRDRALQRAAQRNRPVTRRLRSKGIRFGRITAFPDGSVDSSRVDGVDADLRIKPFFAHGGTFTIRQFVVGAFRDEMGLEAPDPDILAASQGGRVVTPSGMVMDGSLDAIGPPPVAAPTDDPDGDGVVNEIDTAIVDHMEFYLLNYFKPGWAEQNELTRNGREHLEDMGCTGCHRQDLVVEHDRRVADVETVFDPTTDGFNRLFATAIPLFTEVDDGSGEPPLRAPVGGRFVVRDIYTDFKRHDLGPAFWERNFDGTLTKEFITEPLWGVGSTPPYGHDGRSINLHEVILRHGGEATKSRNRYARADAIEQLEVRAFLESLVIFPPDDTASNLNPGDPSHPDYPQRGHGNIRLPALFLDPTDPE